MLHCPALVANFWSTSHVSTNKYLKKHLLYFIFTTLTNKAFITTNVVKMAMTRTIKFDNAEGNPIIEILF